MEFVLRAHHVSLIPHFITVVLIIRCCQGQIVDLAWKLYDRAAIKADTVVVKPINKEILGGVQWVTMAYTVVKAAWTITLWFPAMLRQTSHYIADHRPSYILNVSIISLITLGCPAEWLMCATMDTRKDVASLVLLWLSYVMKTLWRPVACPASVMQSLVYIILKNY